MKNYNVLIAFSFLSIFFFFNCKTQQKTAQQVIEKTNEVVTLNCELTDCKMNAPLYLYHFDGYNFSIFKTAMADSNNVFTFRIPASEHQFYFVGAQQGKTKPIILGTEKTLTMQGQCNNIRKSEFVNSELNTNYEMAIKQIRGYQSTATSLNRQFAQSANNPTAQTKIAKQLKANDDAQIALLKSMKSKYPFVAKIVATKMYLSFPNNKGSYANEVDYYVNEFFTHLDLKDPDMDRMPALFETFRDYTTTLAAVKFDETKMNATLDNVLKKMNAESQAYRFALGAIVQTLKSKNHPSYVEYGNLYLQKYGAENHTYMVELKKNIENAKNFVIGGVAPDFEQNTLDGQPMKLSSLRGKVVLVDFWASWCGPCRRENPHVVKLYDKYKSKGFEVLGVSLDRTKEKWEKAITKDKLTWSHVSDLKGWKNQVAKQYSVTSIPHTILLDKEGRILARNLRGADLDAKLKELFGE
ncbi:MAG: TlpA family protein disulfide reductase [Saprospiraceae bacterium]